MSGKSGPNLLPLWGLVLLLLLAFALRVYRLDGQSLWSDEGASAFMTGRAAGEIIEAAAGDIHPPLYYLLLRGWSTPTGTSEFALRFPSVCFGLLLVALVFKLGQRLLGTGVGLAASFLAAVSPFQIYYSQEARMYVQMALLATLSVYLFVRIADRTGRERRHLVLLGLYILATAAALYTQYFSFTVVLFENAVFLLLFWRVWLHRSLWLRWVGGQAVIALLYLPWVMKASAQMLGWPAISQSFGLVELLRRVFGVFSFGVFWENTTPAGAEPVFILCLMASAMWLVAGGWSGRMRGRGPRGGPGDRRWTDVLFPLLYLLVPVLSMYLLSLRRPLYNPKLLLLATPGYFLLLGMGLVSLTRILGGLLGQFKARVVSVAGIAPPVMIVILFLGGVGYASWRPLKAYYLDPKYSRDDYRGLAHYIGLLSKPEDAILLSAPGQTEIFGYYYKGDLDRYPLPQQNPIDEGATQADLQTIAAQHRRVWTVLWGEAQADPRRFIETWLNQHTYRTMSRWFGNVKLVLYSLPAVVSSASLEGEPKANFGDQIQLLAYRLEASQRVEIGDLFLPSANPGDVLQGTFSWRALGQLDKSYAVFVHLVDQNDHVWGQHDSQPVGGAKPTTQWVPREVLTDRQGLSIPLNIPPGQYHIEVGLYDVHSGLRLPLLDDNGNSIGDRLLLGTVFVGETPGALYAEQKGVEANFGGEIELAAYRLEASQREEIGGLSLPSARPGEVLPLTLLWQALTPIERPYTVFVHIIDQHNYLWGQHDSQPVGGAKPTTQWLLEEIVADRHGIPVLWGTPPGQYQIEVGLYNLNTGLRLLLLDDAGNSAADRLLIGPVYVGKPELSPALEGLFVQNSAKVDFASLRLVGYDLVKLGMDAPTTQFQKGDLAHLTLYWQALERPNSDYLIDLKLVDENGGIALMKQGTPTEGNYPTSQWGNGEIIRDQHRLPLALAVGRYKVYLGVSDNERLIPPRGTGLAVSDGLVRLPDIDVR